MAIFTNDLSPLSYSPPSLPPSLKTGKALAVGIESLTLEGGGTIEDLDIDFTLPGYPDLELKVWFYI